MESETTGPNKKAIIGLVVIVLLVIAATGAVIASSDNNTTKTSDTVTTASTSPSISASPSASTGTPSTTTSFKDGSYTATGSYDSPGGTQSIDVKVTLASDVITDTSITQHPNDSNAEVYQSQFVSGYKSQVIGKKITDVNLSRVSGSSLTSIGFNSALGKIESQAKV